MKCKYSNEEKQMIIDSFISGSESSESSITDTGIYHITPSVQIE